LLQAQQWDVGNEEMTVIIGRINARTSIKTITTIKINGRTSGRTTGSADLY
jgi:hypothetical protein